jgi:hypothetical protein
VRERETVFWGMKKSISDKKVAMAIIKYDELRAGTGAV